jgi:hypothetical protein
VNVTVLVLVVLAGLKTAVTPLGNPLTAKLTLPLKPFCPLTLIVLVPLPPWRTVRLAADVERLKLGATTDSAMGVELVRFPDVPVTVSE